MQFLNENYHYYIKQGPPIATILQREPLYILFGSVSQFVRVSVLFVRVAESPFCNKRLQIFFVETEEHTG